MQGFTTRQEAFAKLRQDVSGSSNGEVNATAASRGAVSVTASATPHTKGSYATIFTPSNAVKCLSIGVFGNSASGVNRGTLLDIAYGGSDTIVIPDVAVGYATNIYMRFDGLAIAAAEAIKARIQHVVASAAIAIHVMTSPTLITTIPTSTYITYGHNAAASLGTLVSSGNGAFGSWVEIGTTSRNHYYHVIGCDLGGQTTSAAVDLLVEIGVGPDSGSVVSMGFNSFSSSSAEAMTSSTCAGIGYPTTSGDKLWARIASGAVTNYGITISSN
jgi:hypothetical protein